MNIARYLKKLDEYEERAIKLETKRMKRKQNICVWCGKRLWWWQKRRCNSTPDGHRIWCQTCSDLQRPLKTWQRDWFNAAIACSIMCIVLVLIVLAIKRFG